MTSFCGVQAAFQTCKTAFQRVSAWVHVEPNFLAFECIRLLLNVLKCLLEWLLKILRALLVFGNNLHRVMLPVLHLQTFLAPQDVIRLPSQKPKRSFSQSMLTINFHQNMMTFGSSFLYIKVMKKNSPQKHFFWHKVRHIWVKKNYCCLRFKWMTYTEKDAQW